MKRHNLSGRFDPFALYLQLRNGASSSFLFESLTGPARLAEQTLIGFTPARRVVLRKGVLSVRDGHGDELEARETAEPLRELEKLCNPKSKIQNPKSRYSGGLVGYIGYDFIRNIESIPGSSGGPSPFPDMEFGLYTDGIVCDHIRGERYYFTAGGDRSKMVVQAIRRCGAKSKIQNPKSKIRTGPLKGDFTGEQFAAAVERAKEYIRSGDIFQGVLSRSLSGEFTGDPVTAYGRLRRLNPSPYMYFIEFGERRVLGASPEMLVRVEGRKATTYPIAGTRPAGANRAEAVRLRRALRDDPKEAAEHCMLVDLARNDLGRVCATGSVKVEEYRAVRRFSHVQHLVSRVGGRLAPGRSAVDALAALFPAGTVSGAPKVRAMEIIAELERSPRGPYAGVAGYLSAGGGLDTAIAIRSIFTSGNNLYLRAGAGIVADSVPEREWEETESKMAVMREAVIPPAATSTPART